VSEPNPAPLFDADLKAILPHRYPFLLVDRVVEFEPGVRIAGIKRFTAGDEVARGHVQAPSLIPTGILLEVVTQLGAVLVLERPQMKGKIAVILQIPSAEMHQPVWPGDTLRVEAEVLKLRESFGELRGRIYRDGVMVAEGQMRFAITDATAVLSEGR